MRSVVTLALLILVAAIAIGAPESQAATSAVGAPLDFRGIALIAITVIVVSVETIRRMP